LAKAPSSTKLREVETREVAHREVETKEINHQRVETRDQYQGMRGSRR
jgi:hypothetical protein